MPRRIRSRLTFANVTSAIALFVALATGGAYAANTISSEDIVDGQVMSQDLAGQAVVKGKIHDATISTAKYQSLSVTTPVMARGAVINDRLADNAVTGNKVADHSLTGADLNESATASAVFAKVESLSGGNPAVTQFGLITGETTASTTESFITALSPNATIVARDLSVKLVGTTPPEPGPGASRTITLREDGADTALSCTISDSNTTCDSGGAMATISPGSELAFEFSSSGETVTSPTALIGWRATTP